jgi:hypothetical protein
MWRLLPCGGILGKVFLPLEVDAGKGFAGRIGDEKNGAERTRHAAGQFHCIHQLFLHKCITAYARHGRHASLRARTLDARVSPMALFTTRSLSRTGLDGSWPARIRQKTHGSTHHHSEEPSGQPTEESPVGHTHVD